MDNKLIIAYFYKDLLNLYGDNGNIEILVSRALTRGIEVDVVDVSVDTRIDASFLSNVNFIFMGGGPDSAQKLMYEDLSNNKGPFLKDYINSGGAGLYICGSYQLLGRYYKSADGSILSGLNIFDLYTEHFGNKKPRCIGNTVAEIEPVLLNDPTFKEMNHVGTTLVGFENHGGRTYLGNGVTPFAHVTTGYGNNGVDGTEGILYKNSIGTYFHGPLLSRNPHIADYLIAKSLKTNTLKELDDSLILSAHTASCSYKQ